MKDWLIRPRAWLGSIDVATSSAYLDAVHRDLWARDVFTFIPDRDLPPPPGTIWVRDGSDALLIDQGDGEIIQVDYSVFY